MTDSGLFDRAPRRIYWEVTLACDLACRHCRAAATPEPDPAELGPADGLALIERLAAFGPPAPHLILTGGDPLKRADLFSLIAAARAHGLGVSVAPSGTPRLTADAMARLKAAGVEAISLSLDGGDAGRHDALRGVSGCFGRTLAAAEATRAVELPFQVNTLVSAETAHDLVPIHAVVSGLGAARWSLFFLVTVGRGAMLTPISQEACQRVFETLLALADSPGPTITTTEAPHFRRVVLERANALGADARRVSARVVGHVAGIRDGNGIMFIAHDGDVRPSGFLARSVGNVRSDDPVALYRDAELFRALRRPELFGGRCGRCEYRVSCGGSRARAWAATGDPLAEDPLCAYEPRAAAPRPAPRRSSV